MVDCRFWLGGKVGSRIEDFCCVVLQSHSFDGRCVNSLCYAQSSVSSGYGHASAFPRMSYMQEKPETPP